MTTQEWENIKRNRFKVECDYQTSQPGYVMIPSRDWLIIRDVIDDIMRLRSLLQRVVTKAEGATP